MSDNGKAFTQDMSPLDMLEQNSRRLADKLHHTSLDPEEDKRQAQQQQQQPHHHHQYPHPHQHQQHHQAPYRHQQQSQPQPQPRAYAQMHAQTRRNEIQSHYGRESMAVGGGGHYNPNNSRAPPGGPQNQLHTRPAVDRSSAQTPPPSVPQQQQRSQIIQQQLQQQVLVGDESTEWRPDARASYVNRAGSISSMSSLGGGILDSFRLSSLPGVKDSDRASIATFRTDVSYDQEDTFNADNQQDHFDFEGDAERDDDYDDSDTNTIQEPSPVEPSDSAQLPSKEYHHYQQQQQQQQDEDGGLLSPTTSINSDTSSVHTAQSHFSYNSQLQAPKPGSKSKSYSPTSPQSPSGNQYFFPDVVKQRSANHGSNNHNNNSNNNNAPNSRNSSGRGLLVPPTLRSNSSSTLSPHASPRTSSKEDERAITNKLFKDMTLEEHVTTGIALHESGNLRESSYHWQYAAFKGEYTAMLLYGLALRHGWGMRKNPTEAVKWLRSAMENSISEFGLDKTGQRVSSVLVPEGENTSLKKAHLGLALYELGMSYLHSWGTEKDEEMALKSFEMAGSLGDADALCEAAGLYLKNGPKGRKKDLQKAARLYREAGEKGANMVGQSWIYKDKYMGDDNKKKKKQHRF